MARPPGSAGTRQQRRDGLGRAMSDLCLSPVLAPRRDVPILHGGQAGLKGLALKQRGVQEAEMPRLSWDGPWLTAAAEEDCSPLGLAPCLSSLCSCAASHLLYHVHRVGAARLSVGRSEPHASIPGCCASRGAARTEHHPAEHWHQQEVPHEELFTVVKWSPSARFSSCLQSGWRRGPGDSSLPVPVPSPKG